MQGDPCRHKPEDTFEHIQTDLDGNEVRIVSAKCADCGIYYRLGSVTKVREKEDTWPATQK